LAKRKEKELNITLREHQILKGGLQVLFVIQPFVAAGGMIAVGVPLVWYSLQMQIRWQAAVWGVLWWLGAVAAAFVVFHWYALIIESVVLVLLMIPGVMVGAWAGIIRWFAAGELGLTLLLLWGQVQGLPVMTLVAALLLLAVAALIGAGAYRPFEVRRLRRRTATLATLAAAALILWQPVGQLLWQSASAVGQWLTGAASSVGQAVSTSALGSWYRIAALRWERRELGEKAKTESLRQLQHQLTDTHRQRLEQEIRQIPNRPLTPQEWEELGIPRDH
jgi:hypothetical protein